MANTAALTEGNYHSLEQNRKYFSVSQFKDFMTCEAMAVAKLDGQYTRPMTKALLVGAFVDAFFEGTLDVFMESHPEIYTRRHELRSEFKKANTIIEKVQEDELFMQFMSGQKQRIMTFELFGVPWKIKMDSYLPGICITDLKVVANFKTLPYWRYDLQGAVYQRGVELVTGERLPFYLAAATKERTVDLDIFHIPQATLDMALKEIGQHLDHFAQVKTGIVPPQPCGHCDYCKLVKGARIRNYNELLEA